jgi:hypothetical protein
MKKKLYHINSILLICAIILALAIDSEWRILGFVNSTISMAITSLVIFTGIVVSVSQLFMSARDRLLGIVGILIYTGMSWPILWPYTKSLFM